jgi:serine/threonine protein kinase/tetratricopeptide (TPR) repeat protein
MTPEEWQRVRPILESALELEPARRSSFLDGACADSFVRREVESLIASHEEAGAEVLNPATPPTLDLEEEAQFRLPKGKRIGAYEIVEEIAVGGMGAVYRAVRADGEYKQQVALKIVRSELGAELTGARFKNERQILASLGHANIAKILDGGTTVEGVPFFVMELVEGQRVDRYCDEHKLPTTERLKLFLQVCSAVQYAHQRLIIHRDIKPGNILVNADGVPKLLDFGIAKILASSEVNAEPEQTISLMRLLTPQYASPEQIKGEPITTASDVYALGVVLYELLTGRTPYHVLTQTSHEISRAVCENEPEKPSTAALRKTVTTDVDGGAAAEGADLSAVREGSSEKLSKRLNGDLDNIVLMALRKEPQRRYASVDQFAQDIRRHLQHLPVLARKDTFGYRTSKFIARHKAGVAIATMVTIALLSLTGITLRQARIARAERARAERRFNDVRKLANSLIFEVHDSISEMPGATAARKLILERAQEYLDDLAKESGNDAELLRELAAAYARLASVLGDGRDANLGNTTKAIENSRKAVELRKAASALQPENRDLRRELAVSYNNLAILIGGQGDGKESAGYRRDALAILEPLAASSPEDPRTQYALGKAYELLGGSLAADHEPESIEYYAKSLQIYERLAKADPKNDQYLVEVSFAHKHLGSRLAVENHFDEALDHYHQALAIDGAQLAAHPDNLNSRYFITYTYSDTGFILGRRGDYDASNSYYRKSLDIRAAMVAADPHDTRARSGLANNYFAIGWNLERKGDFPVAIDFFKQALAERETLSRADPANLSQKFNIVNTQAALGNTYAEMAFKSQRPTWKIQSCREAETWYRKALPTWEQRKAQGKMSPQEVDDLSKVDEKSQACSRIITRADHTPESSRPE